jgi:hypothetical protein
MGSSNVHRCAEAPHIDRRSMFRNARGRMTVAVLVAGAVAAVPAGAVEAKTAPKPCQPKGSTTIARNSKVRVYETGSMNRTVFGCRLAGGKRLAIGTYTSCDCSVADEPQPIVWLNGESVAVHKSFCPPDGSPCTGTVASFDIRKRVRKYREDVPGGLISDLVLKSNGSFAYIANDTVRKADTAGIGQLDPGPAIEKGSLARAGSTVYWTKAGAPFSAQLK